MHPLKDVKAKCPEAYSCGGELVARINNENVVLASLGNGSFNLTAKGLELMGASEVTMTAEVKAEVRKPRTPKAPKPEPVEKEPVVEADSLDDILGE